MRLLAFGAGGCLLEFAKSYPDYTISATYRDESKKQLLLQVGITPILFDDEQAVIDSLFASEAVVISAPPLKDETLLGAETFCDPCLIRYSAHIRKHQQAHYCYLSTTGIYGNHHGAWVDEQTVPNPQSLRSKCRLHAEREWQNTISANICILRLAGIYGNQRNVLKQLHNKPPEFMIRKNNDNGKLQEFSRIHETDIAGAIDLSLQKKWTGIYNLCDDESAPPEQPFMYAASLLGISPPPIKDYADAVKHMSAMQKSFYLDDKKVSNDKIKQAGLRLRYPNYQSGLDAIYQHHFGTNFKDS